MSIYVDSSFLVSLYLTDRHSADARRRIQGAAAAFLTPLHLAEWAHAVAQHVFRQQISAAEGQHFEKLLEDDRRAGLWLNTDLVENAFEICAGLGRRYGPKIGVRTLDSMHVACALELKAERFWTFDDRQLKLAKVVGLDTR